MSVKFASAPQVAARSKACSSTRKGDTIIEVVLAFAIFSAISIISILAMNNSIARIENSMEVTQARTVIDAEAEALRFIHNAHSSDIRTSGSHYNELWKKIDRLATENASNSIAASVLNTSNCADLYSDNAQALAEVNAFIVNYRDLDSNNTRAVRTARETPNLFKESSTYPRLIFNDGSSRTTEDTLREGDRDYDTLVQAEGVYVYAVKGEDSTFYDYYIYTCWDAPGSKVPTTIGTVLRLYNVQVFQL